MASQAKVIEGRGREARALLLGWLRFQQGMGLRWVPAGLLRAVAQGGRGVKQRPSMTALGDAVQRPPLPALEGCDSLEEFCEGITSCTGCGLHRLRQRVVVGEGNPSPGGVVVVVDPPGAAEEAKGEAIAGPRRELLGRMLKAIGLELQGVYLAPAIKCKVPAGRLPGREEAAACSRLLGAQMSLLRPSALLVMGPVAARVALGSGTVFWRARGQIHRIFGSSGVVTYAPAQILAAPPGEQRRMKREAWQDLQLFQRRCLE